MKAPVRKSLLQSLVRCLQCKSRSGKGVFMKATARKRVTGVLGSIYIAIYAPPDARKRYPAVFDLRQLCEWSGPDDDAIAYRDPGVLVTTEERNKDSGASGTVTMNPKYGQAAAGKDVTLTAIKKFSSTLQPLPKSCISK